MLRTALALVLVLGSSTAFAADGKVSGKVVVGGKPLAAGRIFFHLEGGQFVGAKITDGAYQIDRVPTGTRTVTIEGDGVPAKFASEKTSGLRVEVNEGKARQDFMIQ